MPDFPLDPEILAEKISIPLAQWPGNCDGIACAVLRHCPIEGARYARGIWTGPIARESKFGGRVMTGHTWIQLADGNILDPTRFAFGNDAPSIYLGPSDSYDEGGMELRRRQPPPVALVRSIVLTLEQAEALRHPGLATITDSISNLELCWLANRPIDDLADPASTYRTIIALGLGGLIPVDARRLVLEGESLKAVVGPEGWYTLPPARRAGDQAILSRLFREFLDPGLNDHVAATCDELGITEGKLLLALSMFERLGDEPLTHLPRGHAGTLATIASFAFGNGNARAVERAATKRGLRVDELDRLLIRFGQHAGVDLGWL